MWCFFLDFDFSEYKIKCKIEKIEKKKKKRKKNKRKKKKSLNYCHRKYCHRKKSQKKTVEVIKKRIRYIIKQKYRKTLNKFQCI